MTHKHIKEREFDQIKLFLTSGAKMGKIASILGRSYPSISRVNKAKDWADYTEQKKVYARKVQSGAKDVSFPNIHPIILINPENKEFVVAEVAKIREAVQRLVALIK